MIDTANLILKLNEAHARMQKFIEAAKHDTSIYPNWQIKEFIDHLTGWDEAMISTMSAHLEGQDIPMVAMQGLDNYNQQSIAKRAGLDLEHSLLQWEVARLEVVRLIHSYSPEKAAEEFNFPWGEKGDLSSFVNIFIDHEHEHADEVSINLERGEAT